MHPIIQKLPEELICQIAAGEVVERPFSVVKELVENSIDAGATRIQINIVDGGRKKIEVSDNGCGMQGHDIELALTRHATSKIRKLEDLNDIHSLGFRGEALPSIASVSHFRLESAVAAQSPLGRFWTNENGTLLQGDYSRQQGTSISVEDLFYATPARLKFLKSTGTEWGHSYDYILAMALHHLSIEWILTHNGKVQLNTKPASHLLERVHDLLGDDVAKHLYPFSNETSQIKMAGLLSHPNFSRASNKNLFVYINGRYVQDRVVNHAIIAGYHGLLMKDQYPMVILDLQLASEQVDVNVHPAKREVRFANSQVVHQLIAQTIQKKLAEAPWVMGGHGGPPLQQNDMNDVVGASASGGRPNTDNIQKIIQQQAIVGEHMGSPLQNRNYFVGAGSPRPINTDFMQESKQVQFGFIAYAELKPIGQLFQTYILCESGEKMILLDQHAAHERIGFETFKKQFQQGSLASQHLLTPITFDLRPSQVEILNKYSEELDSFGFSVDHFGGNTFVIKAVPELLLKSDPQEIMLELVEDIEREGVLKKLHERVDHVLATMACHQQIRAHDVLKMPEMEQLIKQLEGTPRSYHCPHGRPVMVEIDKREVERWFKRVL